MRSLPGYLLLFFSIASAGTTGRIAGTVRDSDGIPLAGASVQLLGTDLETQTGHNGDYILSNLNPGEYTMNVEMIGNTPETIEGVAVCANMTARMDFQLHVDTRAHSLLTAADQRASIISRDITSVAVYDSDDIAAMPVTSISDIVAMNAGAVITGGDLHIRGGRTGEVVYLVDGVPVTDPTTNRFPLDIPLSAVSEVTVTTGGFAAEYGGAQSAVVNIITRDTAQCFTASLNGGGGAYSESGDYDVNSLGNHQTFHGDAYTGEGAAGGSLGLPGSSGFFITGAYDRSGYNHMDSRGNWDNSSFENISSTTRLSWSPSPATRLVTSFYMTSSEKAVRDWIWSRTGEHFVDDGDTLYYARENNRVLPTRKQICFSPGLALTHSISDESFLELKLNFTSTEESHSVVDSAGKVIGDGFTVDDWLEYQAPEQFQDRDGFVRSGHVNWVGHLSETNTVTAMVDYTNQLNAVHQLKTGYSGRFIQTEGWDATAPPENTVTYSSWEGSPVIHGLYVQDRLEYPSGLIADLGFRLDVITPGADSSDAKFNISPRLGVSYSLSPCDAIRGNYGHYYQTPGLHQLYQESQSGSPYSEELLNGDPELEPEQTVAWELGYRHLFDRYTVFDAVFYNKTVSDLISTSLSEGSEDFWQYSNSEETVNILGIEVGLHRRSSIFFSYAFYYSYSVAKGTESSSLESYSYWQNGEYPSPDDEVDLDWDQTHTITTYAGLSVERGDRLLGQSWLEGFGIMLNTSYGSGIPYDNSSHGIYPTERNQSRYPWRMSTDLRVEKTFWPGGRSFNIYMDVYNLFGRKNVDTICDVEWWELNELAGGPEADPNAYSPARHVFIGGEFSW